MTKLVRLHHANASSNRGPGKVLGNLTKGLQELGLLAPPEAPPGDVLHGVLQGMPFSALEGTDASRCLYGPNIFVLPSDLPPSIFGVMQRIVVPSKWVLDLYRRFPAVEKCKIDIWPVGIDTEEWAPREVKTIGPLIWRCSQWICLCLYSTNPGGTMRVPMTRSRPLAFPISMPGVAR